MTAPDPASARPLKRWRALIFGATWLAYAALYLTRKNYSVAQPAMMSEFGWTTQDAGLVITSYMTAYALGQFGNGLLADRLGGRRMLALGFALTVAMSASLGLVSGVACAAALCGVNGLAQSTGWPATARILAQWFPVSVRGRIMGWWGTSYPFGDAVATALAAAVLGAWGWRAAMWVPALLAATAGALVVTAVRDRPRDVGLSAVGPGTAARALVAPPTDPAPAQLPAAALRDRRVWTLGLAYFCLKFVRYTFVFWIGVWFVQVRGFTAAEAGALQVAFPLAGVAGTVFSGWASDRYFGARRAPVAVWMLLGLAGGLLALIALPNTGVLLAAAMAVVGFFLFGPDMLVAGTAAMDYGSKAAAATVAGFVNGAGSIGAALCGVVVAAVAEAGSWRAVFGLLIAMTLICAGVLATLWHARGVDEGDL